MCFTVNVNLIKEELENRYRANLLDPDKYRPSYYYHAFGLPDLPVICSGDEGKIRLMKWGLIPAWVRDKESADEIRLKTFNARAESINSKPSFADSFVSRRCIVPVKGFFEWQHTSSGKVPWYIYRCDNDIMSLAGLWAEWNDTSTGESLNSFTVITTEANTLMAGIHNSKKRMPVLVEKSSEKIWLDPASSGNTLKRLLEPYPDSVLSAYTIGDLINSRTADKNSPDLLKPFKRNVENLLF